MIFRSEMVSAHWDTWCYFHEGTYHLYYLVTESSPGEGFGVATSTDGVHWRDHGWAVRASDRMVHFLGTGSVWPDPGREGRFLCNYSEHRLDDSGKRRQCILFAWSDDLIHWTKFGDDRIFRIDERYYERYGRWDCIFAIPREEGGYWGTWTASPSGRGGLNGGIGIGLSEDGLRWEALPPPEVIPDADESGAMAEVDGRLHAMFGGFGRGMLAYSADGVRGPFRLAGENALLLRAGHTYFSRYFDSPDGILVNHHSMDGRKINSGRPVTYLAPFKKLVVDEEGVQRWLWWRGNERLKGQTPLPRGDGDFQNGVVLQGRLQATGGDYREVRFSVDDQAYAIRAADDGPVTFLKYDAGERTWAPLQSADRQLPPSRTWEFRLLARRGMVEFYLDDNFIECCSLGRPDGKRFIHLTEEPDGADPFAGMWEMTL